MNHRKKAYSLEHAGISGPNCCVQANSHPLLNPAPVESREESGAAASCRAASRSSSCCLLSSRADRTLLPCKARDKAWDMAGQTGVAASSPVKQKRGMQIGILEIGQICCICYPVYQSSSSLLLALNKTPLAKPNPSHL